MTRLDLIHQLERDIRNQVRINNMLRLDRKQKFMVLAHRRFNFVLLAGILFSLMVWAVLIWGVTKAFAEDAPKIQCPDPGIKCKVLYLTEQEEQMLMTKNGILDTAAQARALDLGQFAVYLKTRIASAPQGEMQKAPENKPVAPVDTDKK